ncbi:MAG: MATE family efflux transporter [Butyrivibrio sp.]|nr:MATE family efflux transporter [Butyrivibrio sp.]MBR1642863.1 MATE family efflux transporter [Butyrivibrio sp.]
MKRVDFENGKTLNNILATALPMLVAQIINLLYNIVDRIYIARIPEIGTVALGAVGLCFPIVILTTAFTNMFGSGGAPLFSIARGQKNEERAREIQNTSFFLLIVTGIILIIVGEIFGRPILVAFGTSEAAMVYALPYLRIYMLGTIFSMISTGMNPFITAQGYAVIGMTTIVVGAAANIILDPIFIFVFGLGPEGAAIATVISQALSAIYVLRFFFGDRCAYNLKIMSASEVKNCGKTARSIIGLGSAAFIMQFTNAMVSISCNSVLSNVGGDLYVSVMTMVNSARQMMETPILAISEGTSPIISYNYGARRFDKIKRSIAIMVAMDFGYTFIVWMFIRLFPAAVIGIFSNDKTILADAIPAFNLYFSTFIFMTFQHSGQVVFKSLGRKGHAIFFSLFRKAFIVVPLTYMLPYFFHMGTDGVFAAEPISNVIGGTACFVTMLFTVRKMAKNKN